MVQRRPATGCAAPRKVLHGLAVTNFFRAYVLDIVDLLLSPASRRPGYLTLHGLDTPTSRLPWPGAASRSARRASSTCRSPVDRRHLARRRKTGLVSGSIPASESGIARYGTRPDELAGLDSAGARTSSPIGMPSQESPTLLQRVLHRRSSPPCPRSVQDLVQGRRRRKSASSTPLLAWTGTKVGVWIGLRRAVPQAQHHPGQRGRRKRHGGRRWPVDGGEHAGSVREVSGLSRGLGIWTGADGLRLVLGPSDFLHLSRARPGRRIPSSGGARGAWRSRALSRPSSARWRVLLADEHHRDVRRGGAAAALQVVGPAPRRKTAHRDRQGRRPVVRRCARFAADRSARGSTSAVQARALSSPRSSGIAHPRPGTPPSPRLARSAPGSPAATPHHAVNTGQRDHPARACLMDTEVGHRPPPASGDDTATPVTASTDERGAPDRRASLWRVGRSADQAVFWPGEQARRVTRRRRRRAKSAGIPLAVSS